jgi:hypothetical protein
VTQSWSAAPGALFPDPDSARDWLSRELSRPEYQESLLERFTRWFNGLLDAASRAAGQGGLSPVVALVLLVLLVTGIALALSRLRANPAPATQDPALFSDPRQTAAEHRRRAHAALEQEQWGMVVVESVRALAAGLVERGLVPEQSDVTAHEISDRAATLFPSHQRRLEAASRVFDETRYGDRAADERRARDVLALEGELAATVPYDAGTHSPVRAVPR